MKRSNAVSSGFIHKPKEMIKFVFVVAVGALLVMAAAQDRPYAATNEAITKTVVIPVEGMTCASCAANVKRALKAIDGVFEAKIDLKQRSATVRFDEGRVSPGRFAETINKLGYKAGTPRVEGSQ